MSDALTDGERMSREHAARTSGLRYCRAHEHGYQDACRYCVADRPEHEDAVIYATKRPTDHYQRGRIDGLREAIGLACIYCADGSAPEPNRAGRLHHMDGWYACPAQRIHGRIADLEEGSDG